MFLSWYDGYVFIEKYSRDIVADNSLLDRLRFFKICLCVGVDFFVFQKGVFVEPFVLSMLFVRELERGIGYFDVMGQYYVVRAGLLLLCEVIGVPVLEDADEVGFFVGEVDAEFVFGNSFEGEWDRFVFENSATGHEPKVLCGGVFSQAEENLVLGVFGDEVDGYEGCLFNDFD